MKQQPKCAECGQPILRPGQRRRHCDDYRHAHGCSLASALERTATEAMWQQWDEAAANPTAASEATVTDDDKERNHG